MTAIARLPNRILTPDLRDTVEAFRQRLASISVNLGASGQLEANLDQAEEAEAAAGLWYDPNNEGLTPVWAYAPDDAADYPASLGDVMGTYDAVAHGDDPTLSVGSGWVFDGVDDGLQVGDGYTFTVSGAAAAMTTIMEYTAYTYKASTLLFGRRYFNKLYGVWVYLSSASFQFNNYYYGTYGDSNKLGGHPAGSIAIAGDRAFQDGAFLGTISSGAQSASSAFYICSFYGKADITVKKIVHYHSILSDAQVLAVRTAMAA